MALPWVTFVNNLTSVISHTIFSVKISILFWNISSMYLLHNFFFIILFIFKIVYASYFHQYPHGILKLQFHTTVGYNLNKMTRRARKRPLNTKNIYKTVTATSSCAKTHIDICIPSECYSRYTF